ASSPPASCPSGSSPPSSAPPTSCSSSPGPTGSAEGDEDTMDLTKPPEPPPSDLAPPPEAASPTDLRAQSISLSYGGRLIVPDLDIAVPAHEITVIVGANACGKSTLLRGLGRLLKPLTGAVLLDGADIHSMPTREVARRLGLLPQTPTAP